MEKINQIEPYIGNEEFENLNKVIKNKWVTEGPFSKEFIEKIKNVTKAKHVLLASNGTMAIYLSLLALGVRDKDEVVIPDFTYNASASPAAFMYAKPVFVDVNINNYNIDVEKLEKAITPKTRVIMPVHIYGQSADMDPIMEIAERHDIRVLEDAAEAFGVHYKNKHVGTIGDVGIFSFYADKNITTGEGGAVVTNDDWLELSLRHIRSQGQEKRGSFKHPQLGMNFRMTDMQSAVGCAQIKKLEEIRTKKLDHYKLYKKLLKNVDVTFMKEEEYSTILPFRVAIRVKNKNEMIEYLRKNNVETREAFYPLHRQPCWSFLKYKKNDFPVANQLYDECICLPVYPGLKDEEIEYICEKIKQVINE